MEFPVSVQGRIAYPWSRDELWRACCDAVDALPIAGVKLYQRSLERKKRDRTLSTFMEILKQAQTAPIELTDLAAFG